MLGSYLCSSLCVLLPLDRRDSSSHHLFYTWLSYGLCRLHLRRWRAGASSEFGQGSSLAKCSLIQPRGTKCRVFWHQHLETTSLFVLFQPAVWCDQRPSQHDYLLNLILAYFSLFLRLLRLRTLISWLVFRKLLLCSRWSVAGAWFWDRRRNGRQVGP